MILKLYLPQRIFLEQEVERVRGVAENGSFTLLPRHADFVTAIVPGIFQYTAEGEEHFLAIDEGVLVKTGGVVHLSSRNIIPGKDLESLHRTVEEEFRKLDERERKARSAAAKLEANIIWKFIDLE